MYKLMNTYTRKFVKLLKAHIPSEKIPLFFHTKEPPKKHFTDFFGSQNIGKSIASSSSLTSQSLETLNAHVEYMDPETSSLLLSVPVKNIEKIKSKKIKEHVEHIETDGDVYPHLHVSKSMINAKKAWNNGYKGNDINIGIIDSGIDSHHKDLDVRVNRNLVNGGLNDSSGHGTHIAGIIAGKGRRKKKFTGITPEANLYGYKIMNEIGNTRLSTLIRGFMKAINDNVDVINLSIGFPGLDHSKTMKRAIRKVLQSKTIIVAAAGNEGPEPNTITYPAGLPGVLAIGATTKKPCKVAEFSSRGPQNPAILKPDLVAPGVDIVSTWPSTRTSNPDEKETLASGYKKLQGTSMAAPHVTSGTAILIEKLKENGKYWDLEGKELFENIRWMLQTSAKDLGVPKESQGAGFLNISEAVKKADTGKQPKPYHFKKRKKKKEKNKAGRSRALSRMLNYKAAKAIAKIDETYVLQSVGFMSGKILKTIRAGAKSSSVPELLSENISISLLIREMQQVLQHEKEVNSELAPTVKQLLLEIDTEHITQKEKNPI